MLISACQSIQSEQISDTDVKPPQLNCSAPPYVKDIWKLEPILVKQGKITEEMGKEEREAVIKQYIRNKNAQYSKCKGKS